MIVFELEAVNFNCEVQVWPRGYFTTHKAAMDKARELWSDKEQEYISFYQDTTTKPDWNDGKLWRPDRLVITPHVVQE